MSLSDWLRRYKLKKRVHANLREIETRHVIPRAHELDAPLVVSLTSFPPRFPQLVHTLRCLLNQTIQPDNVVLWCAVSDIPALPQEILDMKSQGLSIAPCDDLRSYKKLVPALIEDPHRYIATADDDLHYPADWLEQMVKTVRKHPRRIAAHRAHRIAYTSEGEIRPYRDWAKNIEGAVEGDDIFATGGAGALYPPGSLHQSATDRDKFMALCPTADDLWFYWMARKQGSIVRHIGPKTRIVEWPGSQQVNLRSVNLGDGTENGNDVAISALLAEFGPPVPA
ncbi:glycosyltransferase family 2 protein [Thioclava sp. F34-6]|uniref:glycosyltransferase family 2 protein n=1 Tax=Thioclava sp. F34-6 TaxID=1973003 RepID=UPI0011BA775B|nr:glycosyltransferase family 2 protein [Thioclava sp. F34-6]